MLTQSTPLSSRGNMRANASRVPEIIAEAGGSRVRVVGGPVSRSMQELSRGAIALLWRSAHLTGG